MTTKKSAPTHAPSSRKSPPMTAITSTSIVAPRSIDAGIDVAVPPDEEDAGDRRDERREREGDRPVQRDVVAERAPCAPESSRTPWSVRPNGVRDEVAEEQRRRRRRRRARRSRAGSGVRSTLPIDARRRDAADAAEARDVGDLAEGQVRDHRVRQRDHQEVDPDAAARERAEDAGRSSTVDDEREQDAPPRVPAEVEALRVAVRRRVADHEAGDAEDRDLRERDHAAVGGEEDQARRDDAEEQHLRQELADPVASRRTAAQAPRATSATDADHAVGRDGASRRPPEEPERPHGEHDRDEHEREDDRVVRVVRRQVRGREVARQAEQERPRPPRRRATPCRR